MTSTGRGGAGNIADAAKSPKVQPTDLETPILKTSVVTTGRGGSGNMALNKDAAETRARQDVGPIERRPSQGATHVGRGGAANIVRVKSQDADIPKASLDSPSASSTEDRGPAAHHHNKTNNNGHNGLTAKAKELFKKV